VGGNRLRHIELVDAIRPESLAVGCAHNGHETFGDFDTRVVGHSDGRRVLTRYPASGQDSLALREQKRIGSIGGLFRPKPLECSGTRRGSIIDVDLPSVAFNCHHQPRTKIIDGRCKTEVGLHLPFVLDQANFFNFEVTSVEKKIVGAGSVFDLKTDSTDQPPLVKIDLKVKIKMADYHLVRARE